MSLLLDCKMLKLVNISKNSFFLTCGHLTLEFLKSLILE